LLRHLDRPVYALQSRRLSEPDLRPADLAEVVKDCADRIRAIQPEGPYHLLGWSFGGNVAHALAAALRAEGHRVALLAVLDGYPGTGAEPPSYDPADPWLLGALLDSLGYPERAEPVTAETFPAIASTGPLSTVDPARLSLLPTVFADSMRLRTPIPTAAFDGDLLFFRAAEGRVPGTPEPADWRPHVTGAITVHDVSATHGALASPGALGQIGPVLAQHLTTPSEIA
jgi:thioesterase domain-containing protein